MEDLHEQWRRSQTTAAFVNGVDSTARNVHVTQVCYFHCIPTPQKRFYIVGLLSYFLFCIIVYRA